MLLHKLRLSKEKSYRTSATAQNLIENLHLSFNHVPVLTPFSSRADSLESVKLGLTRHKSAPTMDLSTFMQLESFFDCTHVVLAEADLFDKFGMDLSVLSRPCIVLGERPGHDLPLLQLCNLSLSYQGEDAFVALFILTRLFKGTVVTRRTEKVEIFFKVLGIEWRIVKPEEGVEYTDECVVVLGKCPGLETALSTVERVFWIGAAGQGSQPFQLDLGLAGKYKYRVGDLYRCITPAVMKGVKEFDYSRFTKLLR